jgi:two-component system NtrC family sensor kinase
MLPDFPFDSGQIEQVFINIILNAAQAMVNDGVLFIKTTRLDETAVVEFTDTGSGIPDDVMENIFDLFFTTKGRSKGTGLGLSISYGIVKSHGGTIEVKSVVGKGTTFAVHLPLTGIGEATA